MNVQGRQSGGFVQELQQCLLLIDCHRVYSVASTSHRFYKQ